MEQLQVHAGTGGPTLTPQKPEKSLTSALDGTHVKACVPAHMVDKFRGRKSYPSQNVLAVVDFDLRFTYVLAGWEGSAHDSLVLKDAYFKWFVLVTYLHVMGKQKLTIKTEEESNPREKYITWTDEATRFMLDWYILSI